MIIVFNFNEYEDETFVCTPDCPTWIPGHEEEHEFVNELLDEIQFQAYMYQDCDEECKDDHGVLAAAYLATIGIHDEENHELFGLSWLGERP